MQNEANWQAFIELCEKAAKQDKLAELYQFIFTPEEREQLASRIVLTKALLEQQISQREIAAEFNLSISKITRGSNALKMISEKLKNFLKKNI